MKYEKNFKSQKIIIKLKNTKYEKMKTLKNIVLISKIYDKFQFQTFQKRAQNYNSCSCVWFLEKAEF